MGQQQVHYVQHTTTRTDGCSQAVTLQARGKPSVRNLSPQLTICSSRGSLVVLTCQACPNKLCQHGECGKLLHSGRGALTEIFPLSRKITHSVNRQPPRTAPTACCSTSDY
jgi:hypothetical protein